MVKTKELRQLSDDELNTRIKEMDKEIMKLRSQVATGTTLKKPLQIRTLKRTIARILTLKKEKINGGTPKV